MGQHSIRSSIRHSMHRSLCHMAAVTALLCAGTAQAYTTFEGDPKWGAGAPGSGAVVTWSLMPEGTAAVRSPDGPPFLFQDFWAGSNALAAVYAQLDADPAVGETLFLIALTAAFASWSAAANISFVQVGDDGSPIGLVGSYAGQVGDIRIAAYQFLSPFSAVAGHALGLGHPEADGLAPGENESIMYVSADCCDKLRRIPRADDVAGVQFLYGAAANVPEPSAWLLMAAGLWPLTAWARRGRRAAGRVAPAGPARA